jgi:hypothetical protein
MKSTKSKTSGASFAASVGQGLRRAAKAARKTAKMHGMPVYISKSGKIVAEWP